MTTVTSLTADRMLAIEAASVVDGDVVGDNLILTKHDGSQINAGSVRGPQGSPGPVGQDLSVLSSVPVLDVGLSGQIRAGRQLTAADFTAMGLSAPIGLWNLSDLSDVSGNGRNLINKGGLTFTSGINGVANTAAYFTNLTTQAFYITDAGANDPFRIKTGSFGGWCKSGRRSAEQVIISKWNNTGNQRGWLLEIGATANNATVLASLDGAGLASVSSSRDICDGKWHFIVATYDSTLLKIYVDGLLDAQATLQGTLFGSTSALNIGSANADAGTVSNATYNGRIDETFITSDILSEDQIRNLYCSKLPHILTVTPSRISLNVHRRRKGASLAVADFPTQPLRLFNFSGGSTGDEGSIGGIMNADPGISSVSGVDGSAGNALHFPGLQSLWQTDAGLPSGVATRSYGCWFKTSDPSSPTHGIIAWGVASTEMMYVASGNLNSICGTTPDFIQGPYVADGQWHHGVLVEDNNAVDWRRKLYCDGIVIGYSGTMNPFVLAGNARFRIGTNSDGTNQFVGEIDGAFVCGYALTDEQIWKLYTKSLLSLPSSPKNAGDHVEAMDTSKLLVLFDTLEPQHQIDLLVAP